MSFLATSPMYALAISADLVNGIAIFFQIYLALLFVRILLSWFPNIDWSNPIFSTISQLTDPYLNLFRSIIPPIGGLDLSAILAIVLIQIISSQLPALVSSLSSSAFASY
jgi:YggT family protein